MCLSIENAFDKSIQLIEFLKLHVDFLRNRNERIMHEIHEKKLHFITHFMEFFFELKSSTTCGTHGCEKLCHCKSDRKKGGKTFNNFSIKFPFAIYEIYAARLLPLWRANSKKLFISAVGNLMKWSEPFFFLISTLSNWNDKLFMSKIFIISRPEGSYRRREM